MLKGVNYASGAGGILNNSGEIFVSFLLQIAKFYVLNWNRIHFFCNVIQMTGWSNQLRCTD